MIISTLLFNDEFDMLAVHLAITSNYVDRWIISEGNRTFSGLSKPYHLQENIDRFPEYKDRIIIMPIDLTNFEANWQCENQMRRGLQPAIDLLDPNDIVIHADLDEIINLGHRKLSCFSLFAYSIKTSPTATVMFNKWMAPTLFPKYGTFNKNDSKMVLSIC